MGAGVRAGQRVVVVGDPGWGGEKKKKECGAPGMYWNV